MDSETPAQDRGGVVIIVTLFYLIGRSETNESQMAKLDPRTLSRFASYLMQFDPDMPISRLRVFLFIAQRKDVLVRDLTAATGMKQSTVARTLAILADKPQRGNHVGLGWISMAPDPEDPRRLLLNLTSKGKKVVADIEELGE